MLDFLLRHSVLLLLDGDDPHSFTALGHPIHAKFTCFKQRGGLLSPSTAVLKTVKAAEIIFKKRVFWQEKNMRKEP